MLRGVNTGLMDRRLVIYSYTQTPGVDGQPTESYSQLYSGVPAKREFKNGSEQDNDGKQTVMQNVVYTIRYATGITEKGKVLDGGRYYDIDNIEEIGRRQGLKLYCRYTEDA